MKIDWLDVLGTIFFTAMILAPVSLAITSGLLPIPKFLEAAFASARWQTWKPRFKFVVVSIISAPLWATAAFFLYGFLISPMNPLNGWLFERDLPEYNGVVSDIKSGKITNIQKKLSFYRPDQMPGRAVEIDAAQCNHETAVVVFLVAGSAVGHWGYMYDDCDIPTVSPRKNNPMYETKPLQENWYEWAD